LKLLSIDNFQFTGHKNTVMLAIINYREAQMIPGVRIDAAIEAFRVEAMQAVADAAMQTKNTRNLSMRKMITDTRSTLGLSLQDVADRAGITKSHMWELEQGRAVNPTIKTVYGLAKALGISFVSLAAGARNDTE
jgi:DNA-binding XRE family transcriptional regulator